MFALNVMSIWICSRELLRPSAIAQWIETSASAKFARKVLCFYRCDLRPALRIAVV